MSIRQLFIYVLTALIVCGSFQMAFAQEKTAEQQMEEFRDQNKIRSLETLIASKRKDVDIRYAKKEISRDWDKKTKEMQETEVMNIKQPILYERGAIFTFNAFNNAFKAEPNVKAKIKKGEEVLKYLDKLIALYNKDTKKLEKSLKKETDPETIKSLIMEAE